MNTLAKSITLAACLGASSLAAATNNPVNVQTNPKAPVKASMQIVINARPEKVWTLLTDINQWSSWQTGIAKAKLNGHLHPGTTFDWKTGKTGIHSTLHTVEPNKLFGWTGKTFGVYAVHNWTLTEVQGGTEVVVDETMQGFLAGLLKSSLNKSLKRDMQHWLEMLKTEAER